MHHGKLRAVVAALLFLAIASPIPISWCAAPPAGPDRLRQLIQMPTVDISIGFGVPIDSSIYYPELALADEDTRDRLEQTELSLRKDPGNIELQFRARDLNLVLKNGQRVDELNATLLRHFRTIGIDENSAPEQVAYFAHVLTSTDAFEESEILLRKAISAQPQAQVLWIELGRLISEQALHELSQGNPDEDHGNILEQVAKAKRQLPSILPQFEEAMDCLDRAVELDATRNDALAARALLRFTQIATIARKTQSGANVYAALDSEDGERILKDLSGWARQDPSSLARLKILTTQIYVRESAVMRELTSWNLMDSWSQDQIRWVLTALEEIERDSPSAIAASAYAFHGMLQVVLKPDRNLTFADSVWYFERARELTPDRPDRALNLTGIYLIQDELEKALAIAGELYDSFPAPKHAVAKAKLLDKLARIDDAGATIRQAIVSWPDSPWLLLSRAALDLKVQSAPDLDAIIASLDLAHHNLDRIIAAMRDGDK